jgi:hypothetical protein
MDDERRRLVRDEILHEKIDGLKTSVAVMSANMENLGKHVNSISTNVKEKFDAYDGKIEDHDKAITTIKTVGSLFSVTCSTVLAWLGANRP